MRRLILKTVWTCTLLAAPGSLTVAAFSQAAEPQAAPTPANQAPYQLKVNSNLVVVRVVVRDAQNHPIADLTKEDFRLLDRGKLQSISQFAVETPPQPTTPMAGLRTAQSAVLEPGLPQRFVALYFDNLNMSAGDLMQARNAAEQYLAANLQPDDRVALYASGNSLSDFTSDPQQIHDALEKLRVSPLTQKSHDCPDLSDYQAQQITEFDDENTDAWVVALDEAKNDPRCAQVPQGMIGEPQRYIARLAQQLLEVSAIRSRANLEQLERVVDYVSGMPGQRTIVLVSPGFLSRSEQPDLDQIIDHALHAQVVIHALDPRGLGSSSREQGVSHDYLPSHSDALAALQREDKERESSARDVLQEVTQGTGGEFVHNTNDLQSGFRSLAVPPAYYLGFAPTDFKLDGKFHTLKVELATGHKGFTIEARRGYLRV